MAPRVIFITGCSTGFGRSLVEATLAQGDIAIATLRKPEVISDLKKKWGEDRLLVMRLDITKPEEVDAVFAAAKKHFGRLDVVINNAAISTLGEVEAISEKEDRQLMETNFFAPLSITKKAIAFFRDTNPVRGGALIQISSNTSHRAIPGFGTYSASKVSLDYITEALADELDPDWNITVSIVQPGAFRTAMAANLGFIPPPPAYADPKLTTNHVRAALPTYPWVGDADKAARAILKTLEWPKDKRRLRLILGEDAMVTARARLEEWKKDIELNEEVAKSVKLDEEMPKAKL
ncbi:hypothetical protein JCM11641_003199 [Rhodosporidiobolus odoratus]